MSVTFQTKIDKALNYRTSSSWPADPQQNTKQNSFKTSQNLKTIDTKRQNASRSFFRTPPSSAGTWNVRNISDQNWQGTKLSNIIVVTSGSAAEHEAELVQILTKLEDHRYKASERKLKLFQDSTE